MTEIFIDGDACPVREEVYRVAARLGLVVHVVSNGRGRSARQGSRMSAWWWWGRAPMSPTTGSPSGSGRAMFA